MDFDASIDLTDAMLPSVGTLSDTAAADLVRAAVAALPAAKWISVEVHRNVLDSSQWLAVYKPGRGERMTGGGWTDIAGQAEAAVRKALA